MLLRLYSSYEEAVVRVSYGGDCMVTIVLLELQPVSRSARPALNRNCNNIVLSRVITDYVK